MTFKIGDRAIVNATFDEMAPKVIRDKVIGSYGTVDEVLAFDNNMIFFVPDVAVDNMPPRWAVLASELEKLEV